MGTEQKPPLWKVMQLAYDEARMGPLGSGVAAEIRDILTAEAERAEPQP